MNKIGRYICTFIFTLFFGFICDLVLTEIMTWRHYGNLVPTAVSRGSQETKDSPVQKSKDVDDIYEDVRNWGGKNTIKLEIELLEPGKGFHGDEISAKTGEIWLGLFDGEDGVYLKQSKLRIRPAFDPYFDDENDKSTYSGKSVSVYGKKQPAYLFKNALNLRESPVGTALSRNPKALRRKGNGRYLNLSLGLKRSYA